MTWEKALTGGGEGGGDEELYVQVKPLASSPF
jgi:hypothetical protein